MKRTENTQDMIPSQALCGSDAGQTHWEVSHGKSIIGFNN
jgi:hypothetical protein